MQIRESIIKNFNIFRLNIVHIIANISWREEQKAEIWVLIILGYLVLMLFLIFIHSKLLKKQKKIHENLIILYDTLRYQIAKSQYENRQIQEEKAIKIIMEAKHKDYLVNATEIKEEIISLEGTLGQKILWPEQRITVEKQTKKKNKITFFVQIIWRTSTFLTAGIYKLFR